MAGKKTSAGSRKRRLLASAASQREFKDSRKKSDDLFIPAKGADTRWILSLNRLEQIEAALRSGGRPYSTAQMLDGRTRMHLLELLDYVAAIHLNEAQRGAGRPKRFTTMDTLVGIAGVLREQHGIKLAAAVSALVREDAPEDQRRKLSQNIERAYRTAKKKGDRMWASTEDVKMALARINPAKTGNK